MDQADFSLIYAEYKEMVWSLVSRFAYSLHDQEDIFQEVFLKIYNAISKFRGESSLKTWIYKVTTTTAITAVNKRKKHKNLIETLSFLKIIEPNEPVDSNQNDISLLNALNPQQKMIIILSDIEDKTLNEISEIMNIPLGTVKSNLHRARDVLKKELSKNG